MVGVCGTEQLDNGDTDSWDKAIASLEDYPPARAVLDSVPGLRDALRMVRSPTASQVGYWLAGFPGVGDHAGSVPVLLRQYRRQLERATRPKAPRAETRNDHVHEFKRFEL